jgi:hypothetical protein
LIGCPQSILDTLPEAMVFIDEHGPIHSFSATAERLFRYDHRRGGIVTGHPDMPEFSFDSGQVGDVIAYLKSLER